MNEMKSHILGLLGFGASILGTLTPSDLAAFAAAFCGVCTGIFYAAKVAVFIRDQFTKRAPASDLSE